jgi:hypothetical protein
MATQCNLAANFYNLFAAFFFTSFIPEKLIIKMNNNVMLGEDKLGEYA